MKAEFFLLANLLGKTVPGLKKISILGFAFLVLISFSVLNPAAGEKEAEILLLHTNNVTGHLFACPT